MKKFSVVFLILAVGVSIGYISCNDSENKKDDTLINIDIEKINNEINKLSENDKFSGCILLTDENRNVIYSYCYGYASRDYDVKINPDTKFNIMSITKPMTGVAIAKLIECGKINPSDYVSEYIDLKNGIFDKITVEQLLTHTSGLGDYFTEKYEEAYVMAYLKLCEDINDYSEAVELASLYFTPGEKWKYSNLGYHVLGLLIEKAADTSYYSYINENIFVPVDMKNSGFWSYTETVKNRATRYYYNEKYGQWRRVADNRTLLRGTPAMGAFSTVDDISKFMFALVHNNILSDSFTNKVITPKPELNSPSYGYGFHVNDDKIDHSGDGGGVGAQLTYYKNTGYILVILSNYSNGAEEAAGIFDRELIKK